jgi:hypothetical protein
MAAVEIDRVPGEQPQHQRGVRNDRAGHEGGTNPFLDAAGLDARGGAARSGGYGLLHAELEDRNQSDAASLAEGLEETLTLHRLGLYGVLGCSLKTTNCLESVNARVEERGAKVDHWKNLSQRQGRTLRHP